MTSIQTKVKKWGNSLGIILPSYAIEANKIKENDQISIIVIPDSRKVLKGTFGMLKGKLTKSGQQMKDEIRKELYND